MQGVEKEVITFLPISKINAQRWLKHKQERLECITSGQGEAEREAWHQVEDNCYNAYEIIASL